MRTLFALLMFGGLLSAILVGCGLSQQQVARIDDLSKENQALYEAQAKLLKDAESGTLDPVKVAESLAQITAQVKKNIDEIKSIKSSSDTMSVITAILALFGRTALHALAGVIPGGNLAGDMAGGALTFLLGGSATAAKKEEDP